MQDRNSPHPALSLLAVLECSVLKVCAALCVSVVKCCASLKLSQGQVPLLRPQCGAGANLWDRMGCAPWGAQHAGFQVCDA